MAKKVVSRKKLLKEPDRFISLSEKLVEFGRANLKAILAGVGALIVLAVVVVVANQVSQRNERRASEMVETAMAKYTAALQDTDPKTAYERIKPDFEALFDQYGGKQAVKVARIVYGDICYNAGDADTAVAMYTQALADLGSADGLKTLILGDLGHAYQMKKDYPASIRYYRMILQNQANTLKSDALFNLAGIYAATGEKEKSDAMYKQLLADFPGAPYAGLVREKING